jgi:hypothetical protein
MTGEPYAGAAPWTDAVYVMFGVDGIVYRLDPDGRLSAGYRPAPVDLVALLQDPPDPDEPQDLGEVLDRLSGIPMARRTREAIAEALGVDVDQVGCAPAGKGGT